MRRHVSHCTTMPTITQQTTHTLLNHSALLKQSIDGSIDVALSSRQHCYTHIIDIHGLPASPTAATVCNSSNIQAGSISTYHQIGTSTLVNSIYTVALNNTFCTELLLRHGIQLEVNEMLIYTKPITELVKLYTFLAVVQVLHALTDATFQ
jgi:hypothetical protein